MAPKIGTRQRDPKEKRADTVHEFRPCATQLPLPPPFSVASDEFAGDACSGVVVLTIFTIGHSTLDPDEFLALMHLHEVGTVVDVRSAPYSRYASQFNRGNLEAVLGDAAITYHWAGESLGGRPNDPVCYHGGDMRVRNVDYAAMARQLWYQDGVRWLLEIAARGTTAIMCSEENPRRCHRHRLIERSLHEGGVAVLHIRRDGALEAIGLEDAMPEEIPDPQLALLGFG